MCTSPVFSPSIGDRNCQRLNKISTTRPHTGPKRKVARLRAVDLRQDQGGVGFADERVARYRASGEGIAELPAIFGEDGLRESQRGGEGDGCGFHLRRLRMAV